jgi:hypothetical protein
LLFLGPLLNPGFEKPPGLGREKPPVLGFDGPEDDLESGRGPELGLELGRNSPLGALERRGAAESKPGFWNLGPPKLGLPELGLSESALRESGLPKLGRPGTALRGPERSNEGLPPVGRPGLESLDLESPDLAGLALSRLNGGRSELDFRKAGFP